MALAELVGAAALDLTSRLPDEIMVVLCEHVPASAAVADVAEHLMPVPLSVLALRQCEDLPHDPSRTILLLEEAAGNHLSSGTR